MSRWLRARIVIDRAVAAVLLVVLSPLLAIVAVLVKLEDRGPAFIRVPRVGRGGEALGMWKVRSMRVRAPGGLAGGAALTTRDDPRITRTGRWLRRLRLDEVPQLLNVMSGDMALLGPRPEATDYVDLDDAGWREILIAPPGIAGPTQALVNRWETKVLTEDGADGTYRTTVLPLKVELDRWYVRSATPLIDVLSLAASLGVGRGAAEAALRARAVRAGVDRLRLLDG
jgi:lipopolysaccharide/colanic/teichoic acid biosynthesis glycosyltransferase